MPDNRLLWIDNLRTLGVIAVIFIHTSGSILYQYGIVSNYTWMVGNLFDSTARFAVPIFGMIVGATLVRNDDTLVDFFGKRLLRLIPPLIFWTLIFILFQLALQYIHGESLALEDILNIGWQQTNLGRTVRFWYVYMVMGIYLLVPLMRKWVRQAKVQEVLVFLLVWFLLLVIKFPILATIIPDNDLTYFLFFLGYPILGYYLSIVTWKKRWIAIVLIIAGILATAFGTYYSSRLSGEFNEDFYSYLSPNVTVLSIGVFLFVKSIEIKNQHIILVRDFLCKYSYGIYLVHLLILWFLALLGIKWTYLGPISGILITSTLCLILSGFGVFWVHKLPFGKYFSG